MTYRRAHAVPDGLTRGEAFSLMRLPGFAPSHRHAFVLRGTRGAVLFKPGPVAREKIVEALGLPGASLHLARQVHGATVVERPRTDADPDSPDAAAEPEEADALIARGRGHAVGVATADCLPILLARSDGACAAVHAGWRGLLAGVVEAALARLGGSDGIEAAIGPAIGACCFDVGAEVALRFTERFPRRDGFAHVGEDDKTRIDLTAAAVTALEECGVSTPHVRLASLCTRCGPADLVESYRRDGQNAGRMIAVIGLA